MNQADFIEKFESKAEFKVKKHKQKRNSTISAMETTDTLERTNQVNLLFLSFTYLTT